MSGKERIASELQTCEQLCDQLKQQIKAIRTTSGTKILNEIAGDKVQIKTYEPRQQKLCTGHFGKIYALHWGPDSNYIVTASQDGKLIIWNAVSGNKQLAITLTSSWVMTCAFSPDYTFIASGGLDNTVSIFRVAGSEPGQGKFKEKELYCELEKHDGYLSCARFINEQEIISASGDATSILWDAESRSPKSIFMDHTGDVMCVALNKSNPSLFVSGSVDATARIWDFRSGNTSIGLFPGHEADINTVSWFPDGHCVVSGSDDGSVRLFDMRSYRQLNHYINKANKSLHAPEASGVTAVDVSKSGAYIFSAYDNGHVYFWNSIQANWLTDLPHESRVSSLGVSPDGYGLATGCWDFNLRIFA